MPFTRLRPLPSHTAFRWASAVSAVVALGLGVLGFLMRTPGVRPVHAALAIAFLVTSLVAGVLGMRYGRQSNTKGLTGHGLGVFGVSLVQFGLGEAGLTLAHMALGVVLVLGAGALFVLSLRQPAVVTSVDADLS